MRLPCPNCSQLADSFVLNSREGGRGSYIRRRRQCLECKGRYSTAERVEYLRRGRPVKFNR